MTFNEFTSVLATIGVEHHIDLKDVASIGKSILSKHDLKDISSVYFENGGISILVGKHRKTCLVAADEFNDKDLRRAIHDLLNTRNVQPNMVKVVRRFYQIIWILL